MVSRPGPLDEKTSPVMVVGHARCANIAKPQEPAQEKNRKRMIFSQRVGALLQLRLQACLTAAIEGEPGRAHARR
jgi:hypothetical protein